MAARPSALTTPIALHKHKQPDRRTHNLPLQPTPLIGRDAEIAALQARLLDPDIHLLTLTGPAGTGKTRLAIAVAGDVAGDFDDGVWFVGLESVREPDGVIDAIAQALGVREEAGQPLAETLAVHLANRQMLLLLDNFEQVLAAAVPVAALIQTCPRLKVLVTSRAPLRLRWEHEFPVAPLSLPDRGRLHDRDAVVQSSAVQLFLQRAQALVPDFHLADDTVAEIAEICYALDGLPLAIELAAGRVSLLPPRAILERLEQRLAVLTSGPHDIPDRQRTLRAAIAWSYDLISPDEQALFRQLGIFAGGCSLEAAEAVAGGFGNDESGRTALDFLYSLADQSLIRRDAEPSGGPRLRMLETIRAFALEQLTANGERETAAARHAAYFLALAEAAEPHLTGTQQAVWLGRLGAEQDNIRAALTWAVAQGEIELGLRLGGALWRFWRASGHLSEGRRYLETLLAAPDPGGHPSARAKALSGVGNLAMQQGDFLAARALHEESLQLRRELGLTREVAASLNNLGIIAQVQGEYAESRRLHEESLALKRELGDPADIAYSLSSLGTLASDQGDYATARALYLESLAIRRELHDESGARICLVNLGDVSYYLREYPQSRAWLEESQAIAQALGDKHVGPALNTLGAVALRQGDYEAARSYLEQALATAGGRGDLQGLSYALEAWAALAVVEGRPERAARLFGAAEGIRRQIGIVQNVGDRALHDRDVAAARAALDAATFAAAWAAGQALTIDQASAEARSVHDARGPLIDASANDGANASSSGPRATFPNGLTGREVEVLRLIAAGKSTREIAAALVISEKTVERHVSNLYAKIGARGRADATAYAFHHAIVAPADD